MDIIKTLNFDKNGLICAIAQDALTGQVLMQAYMNEEAVKKTLETGYAHYYSRERKKLWKKGEESGNVQKVLTVTADCDSDCLLLKIEQKGVACHTGEYTCFHKPVKCFEEPEGVDIVFNLEKVIADRKVNPGEGSYTNYLFAKGTDKICKKVGEESSEVIIAAVNNNNEELVMEISDLTYHILVLMQEKGIELKEVFKELKNREGRPAAAKYKINKD